MNLKKALKNLKEGDILKIPYWDENKFIKRIDDKIILFIEGNEIILEESQIKELFSENWTIKENLLTEKEIFIDCLKTAKDKYNINVSIEDGCIIDMISYEFNNIDNIIEYYDKILNPDLTFIDEDNKEKRITSYTMIKPILF